jgi:hypothetical protein
MKSLNLIPYFRVFRVFQVFNHKPYPCARSAAQRIAMQLCKGLSMFSTT